MAEISGLKAAKVVLVHGGFVDGSGWEGVYKILEETTGDVDKKQQGTLVQIQLDADLGEK